MTVGSGDGKEDGMDDSRAFPKHVGRSRQWKARKRRELAALEKAVYAVLLGCAYTPLRNVGVVLEQVKAWRRDCSAARWGR